MPEFLVHFKITIPPGTDRSLVASLYQAEAAAAKPLFETGHFRRVWREPGTRNHWALWAGPDANFIHECYSSFPLWQAGYAEATVTALADNENDPGWPGPEPTPVKVASGEPTAHLSDEAAPETASRDEVFEQGVIAGRQREREDVKKLGSDARNWRDSHFYAMGQQAACREAEHNLAGREGATPADSERARLGWGNGWYPAGRS